MGYSPEPYTVWPAGQVYTEAGGQTGKCGIGAAEGCRYDAHRETRHGSLAKQTAGTQHG